MTKQSQNNTRCLLSHLPDHQKPLLLHSHHGEKEGERERGAEGLGEKYVPHKNISTKRKIIASKGRERRSSTDSQLRKHRYRKLAEQMMGRVVFFVSYSLMVSLLDKPGRAGRGGAWARALRLIFYKAKIKEFDQHCYSTPAQCKQCCSIPQCRMLMRKILRCTPAVCDAVALYCSSLLPGVQPVLR